MINHLWSIICSNAVVDQETNNISLQNVLEQIIIEAEPMPDGVIPIQHTVVTMWERACHETPCRGFMRLSYLTPSGEELLNHERQINLSEAIRFRNIYRIFQLPAKESGRHVFRIELRKEDENGWINICEIPLMIIFKEPENQADNTLN